VVCTRFFNALLALHVPEVVLLLFVVFIASGGILGYSSGLGGHRVIAPTLMVSFLTALIVFIIIVEGYKAANRLRNEMIRNSIAITVCVVFCSCVFFLLCQNSPSYSIPIFNSGIKMSTSCPLK